MKPVSLFLIMLSGIFLGSSFLTATGQPPGKRYRLWYNQPAPDLPVKHMDSLNAKTLLEATPVDPAWENWSLPIGNGYLGASLFGRTITDRVQITENSLAARSLYGGVGLTNFAELYIDFNHKNPVNYSRTLDIDRALSTVKYEQDGVVYQREYFASYPDKVMVIRLTANKKAKLSFALRPQIPYQKEFGAVSNNNGRKGTVVADKDLIRLKGKMEYLNILFEGQFKVIPTGGTMTTYNENGEGKIMVKNADAALIIVAVGTNYQLSTEVFLENDPSRKLKNTVDPGEKVSAFMKAASAKTYPDLLAAHYKDYHRLFSRAGINLGAVESSLPTDLLLKNYKEGKIDPYLEELYFQYGRYLLICSSRPGTLPPNLQGIWSQYDITPWTGGYWHNINIQMNFWPAFNTNMTELFQTFVDYNLAYRPAATRGATQYIARNNPSMLSEKDDGNGWTIGTGASAYNISTPGVHSGPGTGTMTSKMFWDYYEFTADKKILKELTYPAIVGMSTFLSKVVIDTAGLLLASPSYSPEQRRQGKEHYKTIGCAFDQQMIYESHYDVLKASKELGDVQPLLSVFKEQLPRLDPVQVGWSGQIKEYREEKYYGEIVDPKHRHTSQLIALYPGTLINSNTPAWLDAAAVSLDKRGDKATGWGMAFRLNLWARIKNGERAYQLYQTLLKTCTLDNLWDTHPPFQIDGNFGGTAGVAEMLLQSHEGFIELLPALPKQWQKGSFTGLLARGNFELSASWNKGQAERFVVLSNKGGICKLRYKNIGKAVIKDPAGKIIKPLLVGRDEVEFNTSAGQQFIISSIPVYHAVANPSGLIVKENDGKKLAVEWQKSPDAVTYNVYTHAASSPSYNLIHSGLKTTSVQCEFPELAIHQYGIIRVTAVDSSGRESAGIRVNLEAK